jgi:hypothetical protein
VTIYHGIETIFLRHSPEYHPFVLWVLFASFLIEGGTLFFAIKDMKKHYPGKKFADILESGDPITLAVIYEDSVAVI